MWPFVGRQGELDGIFRALDDPASRGFVVAGAAGVGKSRLVQEVAARLDGARFLVRFVSATAAMATAPFSVLATFVADRETPVPSQSMLIKDLAARLSAHPPGKRVVLVVDDAHLLDDASAAVLTHLVRTRAVFVLAVVRSGEPGTRALAPLWTEGLVARLELPVLDKEDVVRVLRRVLDGQVAALTVQRLYELTGGNALLFRELVVSGLDSTALSLVNGVWTWNGPWMVAPRLSELIQARLGELDELERWVLELVALSEPVGLGIIAPFCAEEVLLGLERRGLLTTVQDGRRTALRLAHPLYAEALRDACPPLRTRRAKRELSEALAATGARRRDDPLQIARWRLDAGVPVDGDLLVAAARRAWSLLDLSLAERLAKEALADAFSTGAYDQLVRAGRTLWRVLISGDRHAELLAMLAAIAPFAAGDARHRAVGAMAHAETVFWGMGEYDGALASLDDVADLVTDDVFLAQEHAAVRAVLHAQTGRLTDTSDVVSGLDLAAVVHDDSAAKFRVAREILATYAGLAVTTQPVPGVEDLPWIGPTIDLLRVQRELLCGRLDAASAIAAAAHQAALRGGWEFEIMLSAIANAQVARYGGQIAAAQEWLREASALHDERSAIGRVFHGLLGGERAHVAALAGEHEAAARLMQAGYGWPPGAVFTFWADLARPWVSAARGAARQARGEAIAVAARARERGARVVEAVALHDAVRLGGEIEADRLREIAAGFPDGHPVHQYVRHARAVARGDASALEAVAGAFEQLGWLPVASATYLHAARVHGAAGRPDSARRCGAFGANVGRRCPGLRHRADVRDEFDLTVREHEIALLALSGRTNRQIAEEQGIAKRTVDNHVARIYGKLGISTREQLRRLLAPGSAP